jgi:hypothetical protein
MATAILKRCIEGSSDDKQKCAEQIGEEDGEFHTLTVVGSFAIHQLVPATSMFARLGGLTGAVDLL